MDIQHKWVWEDGVYRRIEIHLWMQDFDEYCRKEKELLAILGRNEGEGSVTVFLKKTPEYIELPGYSIDYNDADKVHGLVEFCGEDNIDFIERVCRNATREMGCLRGGMWKKTSENKRQTKSVCGLLHRMRECNGGGKADGV